MLKKKFYQTKKKLFYYTNIEKQFIKPLYYNVTYTDHYVKIFESTLLFLNTYCTSKYQQYINMQSHRQTYKLINTDKH